MKMIGVLVVLAVAFAWIWYRLSQKKRTEQAATYVCSRCGQHHCICDRVVDSEPTDKRSG